MMEQKKYLGAIFDLDGVLVDTAKYHFLAWRELAEELGFEFTQEDNQALKGVSRQASLEILLRVGNIFATPEEKVAMAEKKNSRYLEYLEDLRADEILPGAIDCLNQLKEKNIPIALGSASKNAPRILEVLGITRFFTVIVDGNQVKSAKPDPEVFLLGAKGIGEDPTHCVVFEDAQAGIEAAKAIGSFAVAVGSPHNLKGGDLYIKDLSEFSVSQFF